MTGIRTQEILSKFDILHETTIPHTPQGNGKAERDIRTIKECANTALIASKLPIFLWDEAVAAAVYVLNRSLPRDQLSTPYELWQKESPSVKHLRIYGSEGEMLIKNPTPGTKFRLKTKTVRLVGYDPHCTQFHRVYDAEARRVVRMESVKFFDKI